jgi:uncharacterized damage-inducible protein DinB
MSQGQTVSSRSDTARLAEILVNACSCCVGQCLEVVQRLPAEIYSNSTAASSSIGTHMRHIVERISCVLDGLETGVVEYDRRARDTRLETSPEAAGRAMLRLQQSLDNLAPGCAANLRVSESVHEDQPPVTVASSLDRELMSLVSHTIHHLAIIAMLARSQGITLPDSVGKAPSTILYERSCS